MLCFIYTMAVGTCLAIAGLLVEGSLPPDRPRRWIWCATLALSITIPPYYRAQHQALMGAAATTDVNWWVRIGTFDSQIMQMWAFATGVLLVVAILSVLRVSYLTRRGRRDHQTNSVDGIAVAITDSLGPATVGILRSRVLIPRWVLALPAVQRRYVLQHEEEHRKARDTHLLFFTSLLLVVTPWNLPLYWQLRRLSLAVEMDCDRRVVSALGDADSYGELLLNIAEATQKTPRLQPGFLGGRGSLEVRLKQLIAPKQRTRAQRILLPALAIALLYAVLSTPHPVTRREIGAHATDHIAHQ